MAIADQSVASWLADYDSHKPDTTRADTFWPDRTARATVLGSSRARHVLLELVAFVNCETGVCWPCISTIARRAALSDSTVRRGIRELCEFGVIEREARYDANTGRQRSNVYTLHRRNAWMIERGGVTVTKGGVSR